MKKRAFLISFAMVALSLNSFAAEPGAIGSSQDTLRQCYLDSYEKILVQGLRVDNIRPGTSRNPDRLNEMALQLAQQAGLVSPDGVANQVSDLQPHMLIAAPMFASPFSGHARVYRFLEDAHSIVSPSDMDEVFGEAVQSEHLASVQTNQFNSSIRSGIWEQVRSIPACSGVYTK